jgi:hypothetical protein
MSTELVYGERRPAQLPSGINTDRVVLFMRELLFLMCAVPLEEDAEWLFRFKEGEVVGWSDQLDKRAPDVWWVRPHDGPKGRVHFRVSDGVGRIITINMTDNGE